MSRIFISHSSANNAEAVALRDWLVSQGWEDIFLDLDPERGLKAGERWQAALKKAAERCELVIFLLSPAWAASKWCLAEFLLAKNFNKHIFGLIVESTPLADLPSEMTSEWQLVDLTAGKRDHHITVAPPPGDETVSVAFASGGLERLRIGLMQAGLDARYFAWPPENDPDRAPYRGMQPLDAEDAGIFFGRDGPTVIGLDLLRGLRDSPPPRLLVILGASGAGKSSFLRAGLIPRLARESQHFLPLPVVRPERAVLSGASGLIASLEKAFREAGLGRTRAEIRKVVEAGPSDIASLLIELLNENTITPVDAGGQALRPPTLILPIDQAEELFHTECAQESRAFLNILGKLVSSDAPALMLLLTVRSDRYEQLQTADSLQGLRQHTLGLPPMPQGAYAEIIKGPAHRLEGTDRALKIEEPLVDALLADVEEGGAKDALPLLSFTLERLYLEQGADGDLKLEDYEALGRVKGSIEAAVERALKAADGDAQIPGDRLVRLSLLRRGLIPWLADIDPDTSAPRRRIARLSEIPVESRPLIDLLVEQRLLSTDISKETSNVTVEPVHEALLRQWGLLQGWLAEDAAQLGVMEGVKRASRDWAANHGNGAWLIHSGERLRMSERFLKRPDLAARLAAGDLDYLAACRKAEQSATGSKRRMWTAVCGLILLIAIAGVAWFNQPYLKQQYQWFMMGPKVLTAEQERLLKPGEQFSECENNCPQMRVIPAGTFPMGSALGTVNNSERPMHSVSIAKPFAVGIYEVTIVEWNACAAAGGGGRGGGGGGGGQHRGGCSAIIYEPGHERLPASNLSWEDAQRYVRWLSAVTGKKYRLLTEAEWEYANRGGTKTQYSFGDDESSLGEYAWYDGNSQKQPQAVGKKKPNAFHLYDMHGNVWEWIDDCWHDTYEGAPTDGSAWSECEDDSIRVLRGGSSADGPGSLRAALRAAQSSGTRMSTYGLRVARTINP